MQVFTSKGAMQELLAAMPVHIILSDDVGLLGATRYARKICSSVTPAKAGVQDE